MDCGNVSALVARQCSRYHHRLSLTASTDHHLVFEIEPPYHNAHGALILLLLFVVSQADFLTNSACIRTPSCRMISAQSRSSYATNVTMSLRLRNLYIIILKRANYTPTTPQRSSNEMMCQNFCKMLTPSWWHTIIRSRDSRN